MESKEHTSNELWLVLCLVMGCAIDPGEDSILLRYYDWRCLCTYTFHSWCNASWLWITHTSLDDTTPFGTKLDLWRTSTFRSYPMQCKECRLLITFFVHVTGFFSVLKMWLLRSSKWSYSQRIANERRGSLYWKSFITFIPFIVASWCTYNMTVCHSCCL